MVEVIAGSKMPDQNTREIPSYLNFNSEEYGWSSGMDYS